MLDDLGIQMHRGQQPLQNIIYVFHTDLSLEVLRPVFMYLCVYIYIYVFCSVFFCLHRANWHTWAILKGFFGTFSSVVRQMSGYNSQRRGTARTLTN